MVEIYTEMRTKLFEGVRAAEFSEMFRDGFYSLNTLFEVTDEFFDE